MKTKIIFSIVIVVLLALSHYWVYSLGKAHRELKIIKEKDTEYFAVEVPYWKPKFYTITKRDTNRAVGTSVDDTASMVTEYVAEIDTQYSKGLALLNVKYIQDMPLSPRGRFDIDLRVEKEIEFVPTYKQASWWTNRFIFYTGIGITYGIDSKKIEPTVGVGFGIRIY